MNKDLCYILALLTIFAIAALMILQNNIVLHEKFIFGKKVKKIINQEVVQKLQENRQEHEIVAVKNTPTDVVPKSMPAPVRHIGGTITHGRFVSNDTQSVPKCPVAANSNIPFSGKPTSTIEGFSIEDRNSVFINTPSALGLLEGCNDYLYPETRNFMRGEMMGYTVDGKLIPKF